MAQTNMTILEKAWLEGTWDFQQRVPNPTQYGVAQAMRGILDPYNGMVYNEFLQTLNMIAMTEITQMSFENPLAEFKKSSLRYGSTVRQVMPKWFKAHTYDYNDETLLKVARPEYEEWFYSVNRKDRYDCSFERPDIRMSFIDDNGTQGNELISKTTVAMRNSDNNDEMNIMIDLTAEADHRWGDGLFKVTATYPSDEDSGKEFLALVKGFAKRLKFPSKTYNSLDVPVFAKPTELILMITPEASANVDVYGLAPIFQLDKANITVRMVDVPYLPIPGAFAMLTTVDWFHCRDTVYGIFPWFNPQTLVTSDYLHHQGMYGANPAVPCIVFTEKPGTTPRTITMTPTGLDFTAAATTIPIGGTVQLSSNLLGTVTTDNPDGNTGRVEVLPDSVLFDVAISSGNKNGKTYVDRLGLLHLQKSGIEVGDKVTVTAISTYINPTGDTTEYTAEVELTVTAREDGVAGGIQPLSVEGETTGDTTEYTAEVELTVTAREDGVAGGIQPLSVEGETTGDVQTVQVPTDGAQSTE